MGPLARRVGAGLVVLTVLAGCSSADDASGRAPDETASPTGAGPAGGDRSEFETVVGPVGSRDVASRSVTGDVPPSPRTTSVTREAGSDPQSVVDVEVGEVISSYAGEVVDEGTLLTLDEPILFAFDSAELRRSAAAALQEIAAVLDHYGDAAIQVIGHTDSRGTDDYNDRLSQERAEAVASALTSYGVAEERLTADGRGSRDPVAEESGADDDEARAANRRVEILIEGVEPPQ
jgi:outer membrane protein OmpA-like peptidoglycan-associated protein